MPTLFSFNLLLEQEAKKQAAMNRPNNGSEGWQLTRVCSVKHQKQLSGRQGSWSEKH
jgi:hypothetical protein